MISATIVFSVLFLFCVGQIYFDRKEFRKCAAENQKLLEENNKLTEYVLSAQQDGTLCLPPDEPLLLEAKKNKPTLADKLVEKIKELPIIKMERDKDGRTVLWFDEDIILTVKKSKEEYLITNSNGVGICFQNIEQTEELNSIAVNKMAEFMLKKLEPISTEEMSSLLRMEIL